MKIYSDWISMHKAYVMWFHAAHHLTNGTGFSGDHVNLYGKIYNDTAEIFDHIVERVLGLTNDDTHACPHHIAIGLISVLQKYPSPANQPALLTAAGALHLNKDYLSFLNDMVIILKNDNSLTIGTEDFISGLCSLLEEFNYLLQQRTKDTTLGVV